MIGLSAHTPATAEVLANDDALLHLYTGRGAASQILPPMLFYRGKEEALKDEIRSLAAFARARHLCAAHFHRLSA